MQDVVSYVVYRIIHVVSPLAACLIAVFVRILHRLVGVSPFIMQVLMQTHGVVSFRLYLATTELLII